MSAVELSIIIVSYNVSSNLQDCLNSIRANTEDVDYEIIVIDNNSHDESVDVVGRSFPGVRLIKNPANLGFARASNQGVEIATGSYILFLNPDTVLLNNACLLLLHELRSHAKSWYRRSETVLQYLTGVLSKYPQVYQASRYFYQASSLLSRG